MSSDPSLFGLPYECQRACRDEIARLSNQCRAIFDRLLAGPASNADLAAICLKYTGRISDLRKELRPRGWMVECYDHDRKTGLSRYRLARLDGPTGNPAGRARLAALTSIQMAAIRS